MNFRFLAAPAFLSTALLVACGSATPIQSEGTPSPPSPSGSSGGDGAGAAAACTPTDAPRCGSARGIATAEAFVAEQKALVWQQIASSRSGTLLVSADLRADADLVIDATTLSLPTKCAANGDAGTLPRGCAVHFREDAVPRANDTARVPGVSCAVARLAVRRGWGELCSTLTIARGTVFRMRNVVLDDHPSGEVPSVEIVPACTVPCASGEARCASTQTCFPLGYATCAYCDGKPVSACACSDACNARADGAQCSFDSSPDTPVNGACSAGSCVTSK